MLGSTGNEDLLQRFTHLAIIICFLQVSVLGSVQQRPVMVVSSEVFDRKGKVARVRAFELAVRESALAGRWP